MLTKRGKSALIPNPEVTIHQVSSSDWFIVSCSDGVWDVLDNHSVVILVAEKLSNGEELSV